MLPKIIILLFSALFLNVSLLAFYQPAESEFRLVQKSNSAKEEKKKLERDAKEEKKKPEKEDQNVDKKKTKEKQKEEKEKKEGGRFGDKRF